MRKRLLCLVCLLVFVVSELLAGQEPTFHSHSNVVVVPALVRKKSGRLAYGLKVSDFSIEDDGTSQTVHLDETAEEQPTSLVVAGRTIRLKSDLTDFSYAVRTTNITFG